MLAEAEFLTAPQLDAMLRDVVAAHSAKLDRVAAAAKSDRGFDAAEAARMDVRVAWAYRLLDAQGPGAVVHDRDREAMIAKGLTDADAAFVDQHLAMLQANQMVATPRTRLAALIERHGGIASTMNIASAQQVYFRGLSLALSETERRYGGKVPDANEAIAAALRIDRSPQATNMPVAAAPLAAATKPKPAACEPSPHQVEIGIRDVGDRLIEVRAADENWDHKAQKQARQIYRLLDRFALEECKVAGLAALRQNHLAAFVTFLRTEVYKFYGKSDKDETRTIKQLRKIAAEQGPSLRGIAGGTLNRHLTNLGELFEFARGQGISIDKEIDTTALRARKAKTRARHQRRKMDERVSTRMFQAPCFTGCAAWDRPYDKGGQVYHRALYFAPMLLLYSGARREEICGLSVDDIFLDAPVPYIHIGPNEFRRVKNAQSERDIPLHPEVLRLGFDKYVELIRSLGYRRVFPDLHSPTSSSPAGDRLYDEFKPVLTWACEVEEVDATLVVHSLRHGFNSRLKDAAVHAEERADLMGHGGTTETTERYADPVRLQRALEVVSKLPIVTAQLTPRPIQLLPWVQVKEVAPFSRGRKGRPRRSGRR